MVEALPAAAVVRSCECRGDQAEVVAAQSMQLIGELGALTTQAFQEMRKLQQRVFDLEASEQLLPVATALDEPETKSEAELALPETAPSTQRMRTSRRRRRQQRLERRPYYFLEHMLPPEAPQPVAPAATVPVAGSSAVAPGVDAEQADARRADEVSPEPATTAATAPVTESSEAGPTEDLEQAGVHRVGLLEAANAAATAKITRIQARWRCYRFRQAFILRDFEGTEFWEGAEARFAFAAKFLRPALGALRYSADAATIPCKVGFAWAQAHRELERLGVPAKNAEGFSLDEDLQNAISNAIGKAGFKTWRRDHLQRAEQEYLAVYTGVRSTANFQRRWLMNTQAMSEAEADAYVAAAVDKVVQKLRSGNRDAS